MRIQKELRKQIPRIMNFLSTFHEFMGCCNKMDLSNHVLKNCANFLFSKKLIYSKLITLIKNCNVNLEKETEID